MTRQADDCRALVTLLEWTIWQATIAAVLCGQKDAKIRERGLDKLTAFGCMKAEGEGNVRLMIDELIAQDALNVTKGGDTRCFA